MPNDLNNQYPIIIQDVLSVKDFMLLHDELESGWELNNYSDLYRGENTRTFWSIRNQEDNIIFHHVGEIVKLHMMKYIQNHLVRCKLHINGQTFGQSGAFHTDFDEDNIWTFVLFTSETWNVNWGGQLVLFHKTLNKYIYVPYIPNTGCFFPSNWDHYGESPSVHTDALRTSVAFSYKLA